MATQSTHFSPSSNLTASEALQPFLRHVDRIGTEAHGTQFCWSVGFGLWTAYLILLMLFLSPHFFRHLVLLRRLVGAPNFFSALFPSTASHHAPPPSSSHPAHPASTHPTIPEDVIHIIKEEGEDEDSISSEKESLSSPRTSPLQHIAPFTSTSPSPNLPQPLHPTTSRRLRAEYKTLFLSALVIYIGFILYTPLALWSSITSLQSPAFWKGEIIWADLGYFVTSGCIANVVFVFWPAARLSKRWVTGRGEERRKRREVASGVQVSKTVFIGTEA